MKPKAVMYIRSDNCAMVCAWCCPTIPEKEMVNDWAERNGHDVSHGICPAHNAEVRREANMPIPTTTEIIQCNREMNEQELLARLNGES